MPSRLAIALALAALVLAALAAGLVVLWRRRRRRPRKPTPHLRHPVVLAHGLFGFDALNLLGVRHDYFRGLPSLFTGYGCSVHSPRLGGLGSIAARAEALATCVRALDDDRVNVIAHSMGGLDARYAITRLGLGAQVASLITIGSPHQGTPLADLGTGVLGDMLGLRRPLEAMGLGIDAFYDLTSERMAAFNREVVDVPGVVYASVVGAAQSRRRTQPLLLPSWLYLRAAAGENDGVVPARSQPWGEVLAEIDADHWAQIGWSRHFDVAAFYETLLRELRGRGF